MDEDTGCVRLRTVAREVRGRGGAQAAVVSTLEPAGGVTRVEVVTDLALSGPVAQYARGVIGDVADQMVQEFTTNLRAQLEAAPSAADGSGAAPSAASAPPPPPPAKPISGLRIMVKALLARLRGRHRG
jgi:hypothetical protein